MIRKTQKHMLCAILSVENVKVIAEIKCTHYMHKGTNNIMRKQIICYKCIVYFEKKLKINLKRCKPNVSVGNII